MKINLVELNIIPVELNTNQLKSRRHYGQCGLCVESKVALTDANLASGSLDLLQNFGTDC